jgi:hypothetical protein
MEVKPRDIVAFAAPGPLRFPYRRAYRSILRTGVARGTAVARGDLRDARAVTT